MNGFEGDYKMDSSLTETEDEYEIYQAEIN